MELPDWLTAGDPPKPKPSKEAQQLAVAQFTIHFERVLEMMTAGYTLAKAIRELPVELDHGAFYRWINSNAERRERYKEAKELRTEAWAGKIIEHALGENENGDASLNDTSRDKLIIDTYKWLMGADNRRTYGETKQIELNTNISITAALDAARGRVGQIVDAEYTEVLSDEQTRLLTDGEDDDDGDV